MLETSFICGIDFLLYHFIRKEVLSTAYSMPEILRLNYAKNTIKISGTILTNAAIELIYKNI